MEDLPPNTLELLAGYDWPGNVRELRNIVDRLLLFGPEALRGLSPSPSGSAEAPPWTGLAMHDARAMAIEQFEQSYVTMMLEKHGWSAARAAAAMDVSRQYVYKLKERYGIRCDDP